MNIAIDKKERTIQDVFDDERENNNRINEIEEELINLKKELIIRKKIKSGIEKNRTNVLIDLLKEKKLKWIKSNLIEWSKYIEENKILRIKERYQYIK
mgnify:CR=1 FL=1|tara:strand:- start:1244 stop:1537 length:294 start_codon:yes stop_codon:yes gene_type:complete